jgi:murein tripeptide amidase MpaA
MHGREWISPAVALFVMKQLVENYEKNRGLVDKLDWYIMPVVNPDGYEYTHVTDRLWRKSRSEQVDEEDDEDEESVEKGR